MKRYIIKRLIFSVFTLLALSILVFFIMRLIPGDPIRIWLGFEYDPATYESLKRKYGFDKPLVVQYFLWLGRALHGDLGYSVVTRRPVMIEILERLPVTLELVGLALIASCVISIPLGIISAMKQASKTDSAFRILAILGIANPEFYFAALLILIFAVGLRIFPPSGYVGVFKDVTLHFTSMFLPTLTLGIPRSAVLYKLLRSSMIEVLSQDYVTAAWSKGLPKKIVILKHSLRNALIPFVSMLGLQIGILMSGTVIVEYIFGIPGLGLWGINAIYARDYPKIQAFVLVIGITYSLSNLVVDIVYSFLNPRIRYGR